MGNLNVAQFMERVGGAATPAEVEWLERWRTNDANFTDPERFHIFDDPAISIVIGAGCLNRTADVWKRINARQTFNREVGLYPAATPGENREEQNRHE
ncbi:hypothetical protein [Microbacterium sp. NPDC089696]|uniref:hypothetical protein n=1 Tax=Microbacterium sp. NPDC089696 TaxID=3364199 RepID=UPI0037F5DBE2